MQKNWGVECTIVGKFLTRSSAVAVTADSTGYANATYGTATDRCLPGFVANLG